MKLEGSCVMYAYIATTQMARHTGRKRGHRRTLAWLRAPPLTANLGVQYASMLAEKMKTHGATAWLVNTGWTAGPYGIGCAPRTQASHDDLLADCAETTRTGCPVAARRLVCLALPGPRYARPWLPDHNAGNSALCKAVSVCPFLCRLCDHGAAHLRLEHLWGLRRTSYVLSSWFV